MRKSKIIVLVLILFISGFSFAKKQKKYAKKQRKTLVAIRTTEHIKIDGILNEKTWTQNKGYDDFVQSEPVDGAKPTEKTLVWVAYDNKYLYVAARLFDSNPKGIITQLVPRDDRTSSDWFTLYIDPYYDRRSGYAFTVNPSNSIIDMVLFNDSGKDRTWNGIWESATKIDDKGWSVEMKIPFNQLRFKAKKEFVWGIDFRRKIRRKNEDDSFVWIPKGEKGFVSRFAKLVGIKGIKPRKQIEIVPYMVGKAVFSPSEEGNPFMTGHEYSGNIGVDAKIGLKSNLTMDLTMNPDFGQVEVDPAVMNLTAYETYFEEKRPFFIEGSNIFDSFGRGGISFNINMNFTPPNLFYSRRIGQGPEGDVNMEGYVKYPTMTTILGAAKITGKIGNNWNLGFINGVTAREYAEVDNNGERSKVQVGPLTDYNVVRIQKEFNNGKQGLGFISTGVFRNFNDNNNLNDLYTDRANVFGIDGWTFLDNDKDWVLSGWIAYSDIKGSKESILSLQQSPQHYFQRPDADYLNIDENATSLKGMSGRILLNKEAGHLVLSSSLGFISPGFDSTDLGYQRGGDIINGSATIGYVEYRPGKIFRNWFIVFSNAKSYDFGGNKIGDIYLSMTNLTFSNYWGMELMAGKFVDSYSKDKTRGGPLMKSPSGWMFNFRVNSDSRRPWFLSLHSNFSLSKLSGDSFSLGGFILWKPVSNIKIMVGPHYSYNDNNSQWVTSIDDEYMEDTFFKRYIFSKIKQKTISAFFRINWTFTPKLSLSIYLQPFIAVGDYSEFKELSKPKSYDFNIYGENGSTIDFVDSEYIIDPDGEGPSAAFSIYNPDFNYKSLRGTFVLKWEFKPASYFYLVWTQNRNDYQNTGVFNFKNDFTDMLKAPGDNIFLAKISYRWGT